MKRIFLLFSVIIFAFVLSSFVFPPDKAMAVCTDSNAVCIPKGCGTAYTASGGTCKTSNNSNGHCCTKNSAGTGTTGTTGTGTAGTTGTVNYGGAFGGSGGTFSCTSAASSIWTLSCVFPLMANLIYWLLEFSFIAAVFMIIFAGIRLIISGGDPKAVGAGKKILEFTIIGLVIILLSFFIINFIANTTGVACLKNAPGSILPTFDSCN